VFSSIAATRNYRQNFDVGSGHFMSGIDERKATSIPPRAAHQYMPPQNHPARTPACKLTRCGVAFAMTAISLASSGCSTTLARIDQHNLRAAMMRYQEDQIMDNLIRANKRLPVVHFDMTTMDAAVKTVMAGEVGGGQTLVRSGYDNGLDIVTTALNTATRPFTFAAKPSRDNAITVGVKPVLTANEVYEAYQYFADLPNAIICSPRPKVRPGEPDPHHFGMKWSDGQYYWVPTQYREEFFKLCLRVAVKRGAIKGAASPLETRPRTTNSGSGTTRAHRITPLDAPAFTKPDETTSPGIKALEENTEEIRRQRLLQ
jgi:hypothetical protein